MLNDAKVTQLEIPAVRKLLETDQICVGIVPSHLLVAHYLLELLKPNPNLMPIILFDGVRSTKLFPAGAPVIFVIDLWGLPLPTFQYLDMFSRATPECAFLALDRTRQENDVAQFLRTGFAGFVSHDEIHLLGSAIEAVADGRLWISAEATRLYFKMTSTRTTIRRTDVGVLTMRENQILDLLRRRYSNREVADFLGISESTVKFHVSNVLMKLNVSNRRELTDKDCFLGVGSDGLAEEVKTGQMRANLPTAARRSG